MDFKKVAEKWSLVVNNFDYDIKIENTKTLEVFCIYMEYLVGITDNYDKIKQYTDGIINRIKALNKYTEVKILYNEITGSIEYRTIDGDVCIDLNMLSNESIKSIFGDEFFQFLVVNGYEF